MSASVFSGTWFIGVIKGYKIRQMWFVVEYSDGMEEYTPMELSAIYFSGSLSKAFYLVFDIPMANIIASLGFPSLGFHIAVDYNWPLTHLRGSSVTLGSLLHDAAYSVDAVDLLSPFFACFNLVKSAVYRTVAHNRNNPMFPLAVSPVMVPKTDKQAQEQDCAAYWNAAKARCSAVLDDSLVHWMQRVLGSLMCILRSRPDMLHAIHLLACFVHNSAQDLDYDCRFHLSGDAIHPNLELNFNGLPGVIVCVLVFIHGRYFVQSQ